MADPAKGTRPLFLDQTGAQRPGPGPGSGPGSPLSQGLDDRSLSPLSAGLNFGSFHTVWTGHLT